MQPTLKSNLPSPVSRDAPYTRLRIEVWDYDLVGVDDFMGEVTIDLTYLMTGKVFVAVTCTIPPDLLS